MTRDCGHRWFAALALTTSLLAPAPAAAETSEPPRVIHVSGHATVKTEPDRARIAVSVITRADTAREASETNARTSKDVLAKLRAAVAPPGEVSTGGYDLAPLYDYEQQAGTRPGGPRLVGYSATNRLQIVTADLAGLGALIDAAVASGANQIDSIGFYVADEQAPRKRALAEAGRVARADAEAIAQGLGVTLGDVVDASSTIGAMPMPVFARTSMAMTAEAAPTEVVPGSLEIAADVTVTFAIRPAAAAPNP
jgi:uncharacterized protein YggE